MNWIVQLVTAAIVAFFFWYSNKKSSEIISPTKDGKKELRMNDFYKWVGNAAMLCCIIALSFSFFSYNSGDWVWICILIISFGGLGFVVLGFYNNHMVIFSETTVYVSNWRGVKKDIRWSEIENVKFNIISGYLVVYSINDKLKLHMHLKGLNSFVLKLEGKTGIKADELKLPFKINRNSS